MAWLKRLRSHFREEGLHRDIEDEIASHLELRTRENIEQGMTPDEAGRAARLSFGNTTALAEKAREAETILWLDAAWQNLRYAFRALRKTPATTLAAVLSLAIGIGANTAVFTLLYAVMFRALPVPDPQQLVSVNYSLGKGAPDAPDQDYSPRTYRELRDGARNYIDLWANMGAAPVMTFGDVTQSIRLAVYSGNYYTALEARPYLGRLINAGDDNEAGPHPVAVLTYHAWRRLFAADPAILGKQIFLNGSPFTVIGVEPSAFSDSTLSSSVDAVIPFSVVVRVEPKDSTVIAMPAGRLRQGVSLQQAQDGLTAIYRTVEPKQQVELQPGLATPPYLRDRYQKPLTVLMAAVSLVLLIACVNVANLLLARGEARRQEIAVRMAIGAGRFRIISQLLTESLLIALCGSAFGIGLAYFGDLAVLSILRGTGNALAINIHPDARVLAFTIGIAILTGLLFGLFPAFQAVRTSVNPWLKDGAHVMGRPRFFVRRVLLVAQVALSLVLLAGAGLFGRSLLNLRTVDSGYDRRGVLLAAVDASNTGYSNDRTAAFFTQLLTRVREIPGVESAGYASDAVLGGAEFTVPLTIDGARCETAMSLVSDGYIETMRIGLLEGRTFTPRDVTPSAPRVILVNQALAHACFGDSDPIGRRVSMGHVSVGQEMQIVGMVRNAKYRDLRESDRPMFYVPSLQGPGGAGAWGVDLHIRSSIDPGFLIAPVRRELHALNPSIPLTNIRTMEEQSERSLTRDRLLAILLEAFGGIALALAIVGIYGVLAFMVTRRTSEIGVRMALGASRANVAKLVLQESLLLVLAGAVIGAVGAHAARRSIQSLLYGVGEADERTTLAAAAILLATALLAAFPPARRASRIDPMAALRQE